MTTGYGIPWHHAGRRVLHNPFQHLGEQYCLHCKEWGSAEQEARYEGKVYAHKQWCRKCGRVIGYAVVANQGTPRQRQRAQAWATSREQVPA